MVPSMSRTTWRILRRSTFKVSGEVNAAGGDGATLILGTFLEPAQKKSGSCSEPLLFDRPASPFGELSISALLRHCRILDYRVNTLRKLHRRWESFVRS